TSGFSAGGTVIAVKGGAALVASGLDGFADGWFDLGVVTWPDGRRQRVATHRRLGGQVVLTLRDGEVAGEAGDAFEIVAGCDKRLETCRGKFGNVLNFQGFPYLPGNDAAYAYVNDSIEFDGGPLVP
ncbi:MAG: phage BR0599 family protein, partial [Mesorhizobium sp.]